LTALCGAEAAAFPQGRYPLARKLSDSHSFSFVLSGSLPWRTPAEDAAQLLAEAGEVLAALESLIRRINRTNATVEMGQDGTLTDALARRDVLRLRHSVVTAAADAAAGKGERGYGRQHELGGRSAGLSSPASWDKPTSGA
jgi:hypothetical protein